MATANFSFSSLQRIVFTRCRPRLSVFKRCKSSDKSISPQKYCLDLVRNHDYENFLCSLLLSSTVRPAAFAVRSFNVELSKVKDQVSEARLAQMRLQFWHDTLERLFNDNVPQHPVAQELHKAIKKHQLQKHHLRNLVSSRIRQASVPSFSSLEAVEQYAENSVSPVYYLLLQAEGLQNIHADHAASHIGKAQGLANLVRGVPYHSARREVTLPLDVLASHGVSHEAVLRGSREQPVRDVVFEVATRAKKHLDKAKSMQGSVPKEAHEVFLPAASTAWYLDQLQELDFDVFHPALQRRNHWLPWTLYVNKFLKRY